MPRIGTGSNTIHRIFEFAGSSSDTPGGENVERTCHRVTEHGRFCETTDDLRHALAYLDGGPRPGCPSTKVLRPAMDTEAAAVVSVARRMLGCYDDVFEKREMRVAINPTSNGATELTQEMAQDYPGQDLQQRFGRGFSKAH